MYPEFKEQVHTALDLIEEYLLLKIQLVKIHLKEKQDEEDAKVLRLMRFKKIVENKYQPPEKT